MQLELLDYTELDPRPTAERWYYPLVTVFQFGSSDLYYIAATSRREAIVMAEGMLRAKYIPFKNVACLQGTYWRLSIHGYPCSPINQADYWI